MIFRIDQGEAGSLNIYFAILHFLFKIRKIQRLLDLNQERIKSAEIAADWETQVRLMKVTMKIDNTRRELTQKLNMVINPNKK